MKKIKQNGFSLLELLLVVAVGAVLILAGLGAYRLVSENNNTSQAIRQLTTLKQQVQQTFAGQGNYPATATLLQTLQNLNAIPGDLSVITVATGAMRGALGPVVLANAAAGATFTIAMNDVPRSACSKLALSFIPMTSTVVSSSKSSDVVSLTISATAVGAANYTLAGILGTAAGTCQVNAANNDMIWTFN